MEIIEKEKEVIRDGKHYASASTANAGLATGIVGTALGAMALFGNGNGSGLFGGWGGGSPSAFQAWEKAANDTIGLQRGFYDIALLMQNNRFNDRQTVNEEMFRLYKSQVDADFGLYKSSRDGFDVLNNKINDLATKVAVNTAIRPYQDRLILSEIDRVHTAGINYTDRKTCRMITGQLILPEKPLIAGYGSYDPCCPATVEE